MDTEVDVPIHGRVDPAFEPVRRAFADNFRDRNELGAACTVIHRGRTVVDVWGGFRDVDRSQPWTEDTMVLVFSSTKGMAATAMTLASSRGLFDVDDRVAEHWPAFGQRGKVDVTIRQLLDHQAGLAALDASLTPAEIDDARSLSTLLARKRPDWEPGTRHGYHAFTLGWYESELLRHVDPDGRSLGEFFAAEIADPLDLEFYIGLPGTVDDDRIADVDGFHPIELLAHLHTFPPRMVLSLCNPWSITARAMNPFDVSTPAGLNDPAYRAVEIPAGNGIGTVRSLARVYGSLATGGEELGLTPAAIEPLEEDPTPPADGWRDVVLKTDTAYRLGFWKPGRAFDFGASSRGFGAPGAGGSFAFADPDHDLGFAYAPNRMGTHPWNDPRERALREAVYECLEAASRPI